MQVQVFKQAGVRSPVIGSIIVGAVNAVGTSIAVVLMDKVGRRPLLIGSHAGMAVCLVSMSVTKFLHGEVHTVLDNMQASCKMRIMGTLSHAGTRVS